MSKFRKKPVIIEAEQWFKNGDCLGDYPWRLRPAVDEAEGLIVRYYRHPQDSGQRPCEYCRRIMHVHGWIDTKEGGHIVCPGDWIITGVAGEQYPCKPSIFEATYEGIIDAGRGVIRKSPILEAASKNALYIISLEKVLDHCWKIITEEKKSKSEKEELAQADDDFSQLFEALEHAQILMGKK